MKKKILISIAIIIFLGIGFSLYSFNQKLNQPINAVSSSVNSINNASVVVEKRDIKSLILANGNVRAEETEDFLIEPGKKIKYFVKDGQEVNKGQILYQIIDKDLELQYKQALREKSTLSSMAVDTAAPLEEVQSGISQINNQIAALKEKLEANKIKANFNGIISMLNTTGSPENTQMVVKINNLNSLIVPVNFEEVDYPKVKKGQSATLKLTAYGNKIFTGQVARVSKEAITKDGVVYIPGVIKLSQNPLILPGMSTEVNILINSKNNVLSLPLEFIQEDEKGNSFVNVIKEGNDKLIEKKIIRVGIKDDKFAEILSGLKEGDMVQLES